MRALYLTHPQVAIDATIPVPQWGLSAEGRQRAEAFARSGAVPSGAMIFSSTERKALELAELLAAVAGTVVLSEPAMGENDRSATGFLPPDRFEATADRFFAAPEQSIDGWERAIDAQRRIVAAVAAALTRVPDGTPAILCGHGAVGTLLKCQVAGRAISRAEDQGHLGASGGGNGLVFDFAAGVMHTDWTAMEQLVPDWFAPR